MRIFPIVKLLLSVLFALILLVNQTTVAANIPEVSSIKYGEQTRTKLDGEWLFFANQFYSSKEVLMHSGEGILTPVPSKYYDNIKSTDGYGTFAIRVHLPSQLIGSIQAIRIPYQYAAMDVYIDDNKVMYAGKVANNKQDYKIMHHSPIAYFEVKSESFIVVVHFSTFGMMKSGFSAPLEIGEAHSLNNSKQHIYYFVVFLLGILILVGMFSAFIGVLDKQQRISLLFGLFSIVVMLRSVITMPFLYTEIMMPFELTYDTAIRIEYIFSLVIGFLFMVYLIYLYKHIFNHYVLTINKYIYVLSGLIILFIPAQYIQNFFTIFVAIQASLVVYVVKVLYKAYKMNLKYAQINIFISLLLASTIIFELLSAFNIVPPGPYDLVVLTLISVMLTYNFGRFYVNQIKKLHDLNQQLCVMNNSLDELVQKRTDELTVLNIKLHNQAVMDGLTGIYNRSYLNEKLEEFYWKAIKNNDSLALVIFDIDEFKQYNDQNGHLKGDKILINIVTIIKEELPPNTIFARFGGEEFVLLFYNYEKDVVVSYCESIRFQIEKANIEHDSSIHKKVTISLGGAYMESDNHVQDAIELLERADRQLYVAKRSGKNKISFN